MNRFKKAFSGNNPLLLIPLILLFWLCNIFFNIPQCFSNIPYLNTCYGELAIGFLAVIFVLYCIFRKKRFQDVFLWLSLGIFLTIALSSVLNKSCPDARLFLYNYFLYPLSSILFCSLFFEADLKRSLLLLFIYYAIFAAVNNVTMFTTMPDHRLLSLIFGDELSCMAGNVNLAFIYSAVAILLGVLIAELYCKWVWILNFGLLIFSYFAAVRQSCITAYLIYLFWFAVFLIAFIFIPVKNRKLLKPFNGWFYLGLSILTVCLVTYICFNDITIDLTKYKLPLIEPSFHGRGPIWKGIFQAFPDKPFIGFGATELVAYDYIGAAYVHCHNFFFDYLYHGGIVCLLFYLGILVLFALELQKIKEARFRFLLASLLGGFLIAGMLDAFTQCGSFAFYAPFYYTLKIINQNPEEHLKKLV